MINKKMFKSAVIITAVMLSVSGCSGGCSKQAYKCELSETQQIQLLKIIRNAKAKIVLCGYKSEIGVDLYDVYLLPYGWKCYKLMDVPKSAQRKDTKDFATEFIWCNYELPIWSGYYISLKEYSTLK